MVLIANTKSRLLNKHAQLPSGATGLNVGLNLPLFPYFSGGSRGGSGVSSVPPSSPPPPPFFKYPMKMKQFGLAETNLFHFHGIFQKKEINQQSETPPFIHMNPLFRYSGSASVFCACEQ